MSDDGLHMTRVDEQWMMGVIIQALQVTGPPLQ